MIKTDDGTDLCFCIPQAPKAYKFDYAVHDPDTYDVKSQWEAREGDVVKGAYSVLEPDGAMRLVEYTAGPETGFNAVVSRSDSGNTGYRKPSNDAFDFWTAEAGEALRRRRAIRLPVRGDTDVDGGDDNIILL